MGAVHLRSLVGGLANGMPLYDITPLSRSNVAPCKVPYEVVIHYEVCGCRKAPKARGIVASHAIGLVEPTIIGDRVRGKDE